MEKNTAILMADLSGYTALTETHGAEAAADTVDRYLQIVKHSLIKNCKLQERKGDEVMIISSSPDALLATASQILESTSREENFLEVHGALHYGKILHRNNSYFGTAINITARIAARAKAGTFWCSKEFLDLTGKTFREFEPKGNYSLKNLEEPISLFELKAKSNNPYIIDPLCRMILRKQSNAVRNLNIENHFFCSKACLNIFEKRLRKS